MHCACPRCSHKRAFIYMVAFTLVVYFLTKDPRLTASVLLAHFVLFHLL